MEQFIKAGLGITGGETCTDCGTRYEGLEIYGGKYDMRDPEDLITRMLADPENTVFNKANKTWSYNGQELLGSASSKKKAWQFWKR